MESQRHLGNVVLVVGIASLRRGSADTTGLCVKTVIYTLLESTVFRGTTEENITPVIYLAFQ